MYNGVVIGAASSRLRVYRVLDNYPNQIIEYYDELSIAGWFVLAIGLIFFLTGYYLLFEIIKGRKNVCL